MFGIVFVLTMAGCTGPMEYIRNGMKVGPNYKTPPVAVANDWIDAADKRIRRDEDDIGKWWTVFNDPTLNSLVDSIYAQNLTLRQAGLRVLEARAQLGITIGNLFPQSQKVQGSFSVTALSLEDANVQLNTPIGLVSLRRFYSQWNLPIGAMSWEIDIWGRFRRSVESNARTLDASVADYQDVLVTLLSDAAASYVAVRTVEKQLEYTRINVELQKQTLKIVESRFKAGTVTGVDLRQSRSILAQTESQIPELEIMLRQTQNHLCTLLGIPPEDLRAKLGQAPIPTAAPSVAVGIPANLLRRRPDVRRAERLAAAQSAQIGVAEADFYPAVFINGNIGWSAQQFPELWRASAFTGTVGPSFQWNVLNYGRILNNVRLQKAKFQEAITAYRQKVLQANQEVEDGLVMFFKAQQRAQSLAVSAEEALEAVKLVIVQYERGTVDFTRVTQLQQSLVLQQDSLAQAQGEIARGLIQVYKGLGGGWEYFHDLEHPSAAVLGEPIESLPPPLPAPGGDANGGKTK